MKKSKWILNVLLGLSFVYLIACQEKKTEEQKSEEQTESTGENQRDYIKGENEESGKELALNEKYDRVLNGARLILTYDAESNSFLGTVENINEKKLEKVRVKVYLSNGVELGPTTTVDIEGSKKMNIKLSTISKGFDAWTAHLEIGGGK